MIIALLILTACEPLEPLGYDQHGALIPESQVTGQWLVINYWAVWCAPCRQEVPILNALHEALAEQGVRVFGVNYDQLQGSALLADSQRLGITFPVLRTDPVARFDLPQTRALPATYIISPQGRMVSRLQGEQSKQSIIRALREAGWSAPE